MADPKKAVEENVPGEFFVDTTCINCDTCRQLARSTFKDAGEFSSVFHQPTSEAERRAATRALLCCPTGSIGTREKNLSKEVIPDFPLALADRVYYCGFNSEASFGANSYFIRHPDGNWLVDSPKYLPSLVSAIENLGGVRHIFLTHQDDVADCDRYAAKFGAERIIHKADLRAVPNAEVILEGTEAREFKPGFTLIPVPGHTRGSVVLLHEKFLFTGDHLAYDPETEKLEAFRRACWYSWEEQIKSMERLLQYEFEWVIAGHGDRVRFDAKTMREKLEELLDWMKTVT
jgi:glyoxylase-like metal-dependent hydrolase (beta-lactamase superfamily II)/ferredoxin